MGSKETKEAKATKGTPGRKKIEGQTGMFIRLPDAVAAALPERQVSKATTQQVRNVQLAFLQSRIGVKTTEEELQAHLAEKGLITQPALTKQNVIEDLVVALVNGTAPQTEEAAGLLANAKAAAPRKSRGKAAPVSS